MKGSPQYTADTIVTFEGLQAIRNALNAYLPDNSPDGFRHMVWEYVTNSMDEFVAQGIHGNIELAVLTDPTTNRFQIIVKDDGRGIPPSRLKDAYTRLHATGKRSSNSAYRSTTGQFGLGAKVGCGTARVFKAISSNATEQGTGNLLVENASKVTYNLDTATVNTGVTIVFEPDTQFFTDCDNYGHEHYGDLVNMLRELAVFNDMIDFKFYRIESLIPDKFWTAKADEALTIIDRIFATTAPLYDTNLVGDRDEYLFSIWSIINTPSFKDEFYKPLRDENDRLQFILRLYFTKKSKTVSPQYFITVNNVTLRDYATGSVTTTFIQVLREMLAPFQSTDQLKEFVAKADGYRFPTMMLAAGVFYNGARHSGTTKSAFKDKVFAQNFYTELKQMFSAKGPEYWKSLAEILSADVEYQYSLQYNIPIKKADMKRTFVNLNVPRNYYECKSTDHTKTELYIVEGNSASNIITTRDPEYQAVYTTRGVPINPATHMSKFNDDRTKLVRDNIYHDIVTILGINRNTTDMSTCRFSKIIIATDADPDGYHIAALHIHDLYMVNPLLISQGFVWVANPPLYSLALGKNKYLFLRDKRALMDARIEFIYKPALEFTIITTKGQQVREINVDNELYRETSYLLNYLGEKFEVLAAQLKIPLLILERLVYAVDYLYPVVQYDKLPQFFMSSDAEDMITVDPRPEQNALVVSIGMQDYTIGLADVGEMIRDRLLSNVKHFRYNDVCFKIRGKLAESQIKDPMTVSPMQFYLFLKQLNEIGEVMRYKGLGQMPTASCYETLMDPTTRSLTHITSIGDAEYDYRLLGRDTDARKDLLVDNNCLGYNFKQAYEADLENSWVEVQ